MSVYLEEDLGSPHLVVHTLQHLGTDLGRRRPALLLVCWAYTLSKDPAHYHQYFINNHFHEYSTLAQM